MFGIFIKFYPKVRVESMKRIIVFIITAVMMLSLAACGASDAAAPEITGVSDKTSVAAGSVFDALKGVKAIDDVDGDITDKIMVTSIPELTFTGGKTTPASQGDYELTYTVKDKSGKEGKAYSTLTVTRTIKNETLFKSYELDDTDYTNVDNFGLELIKSGSGDATLGMTEGNMRLDVKNSGAGIGDVKIYKETIATVAETEYEIVFYMKSSAPIMFNMLANNNTSANGPWNPVGTSAWNVAMNSDVKAYSLGFAAPSGENQNVEIILEMGKHSLNDVSNPESYIVDIVKVEYFEKTGTDIENRLYAADYSEATDTFRVTDTTKASVSVSEGKGVVNINSYGAESWENKIEQDTNISIEPGKKYRFKLSMIATNNQSGDFCIEDKTTEWQARALYLSVALVANTEYVLTHDFVSESANTVENPSIKYYIGKASEGVTSNKITINKIEIYELTGDKAIERTNYRFIPYNKESEWDCFNGTDSALPGGGVGSMWEADGSMFYRIDRISDVDYGNKIFINKIKLDKNALYKVKFKIKANKPGQCWFILNKYQSFDPRINETISFDTTEKEVVLSTTQEFPLDMDFEFVFTFGKAYNTESNLLIQISDVEIYKMT